ncbi:MAG: alpha/beta hydrolase [Rhodospirillales bacterium]|jgi:pimeloyl-ACP methyl ester carboxylesterase|nr:alpha/beta hydrolase [Rhodospirillales bacterium]
MSDYQEHIISSTNALPLYVRDYASKQSRVVLCLGGLTRNSKDFHQVALRLSESGYRVVCPDYRGRGLSAYDPDWQNYNPRVYLDDIRQVTTALNIHRFAVIGTSLGGILGMALGVAMPSSLIGVLMNDVSPDIPAHGMKPVLDYMADTAPLDTIDHAVEKIQKAFPNFPASTPEDWHYIAQCTYKTLADGKLVYDWDSNIAKPFFTKQAQAVPDLWALYASLRQLPVALVRGALSPFVPDASLHRMQTEIPGLKSVAIENVGHAPSLSEQASLDLTDIWLKDCFSESS